MTTLRTTEHGGTHFRGLPVDQRKHGAVDDCCCCRFCSATPGVSGDNPDGVWDTLATDLATGKTWLVHYPELTGRGPKRARNTN